MARTAPASANTTLGPSPIPGDAPTPAPGPAPQAAACAAAVLEVVPAVMDALRCAMRNQVGDALSVPQFRGLDFVARHPGCSVGEVAAFLGVTMPTASALLDRLARAGLLAPRTESADRRRSVHELTAGGRARIRQMQRGAQADFEQLLRDCGTEELTRLLAGLDVLRRTFGPA